MPIAKFFQIPRFYRILVCPFAILFLTSGCQNFVAKNLVNKTDVIACGGSLRLALQERYGTLPVGAQLTGTWGLFYDPTLAVVQGKSTYFPAWPQNNGIEFTDQYGIQYDARVPGITFTNGHTASGWKDGVMISASMLGGAKIGGVVQNQPGSMTIHYLSIHDSVIETGDTAVDLDHWDDFGMVMAGVTNSNPTPQRPQAIIYPLILNTGAVNCRETTIFHP